MTRLFALAPLLSLVAAHGKVFEVIVDGLRYAGYEQDYASSGNPEPVGPSAAWKTSIEGNDFRDNGFIAAKSDELNSPHIIGHKDAEPAQAHIVVQPGSEVFFKWGPL